MHATKMHWAPWCVLLESPVTDSVLLQVCYFFRMKPHRRFVLSSAVFFLRVARGDCRPSCTMVPSAMPWHSCI